jgi:hypothetical protein
MPFVPYFINDVLACTFTVEEFHRKLQSEKPTKLGSCLFVEMASF